MWFKAILVFVLVVACPLLSTCARLHREVDQVAVDHVDGVGLDSRHYDPYVKRGLLGRDPSSTKNIMNVEDYRNVRSGGADNEAFEKAWELACNSERGVFEVPKGRIYRLKPINFSGPCKPNLIVRILGQIRASVDLSDYEDDRSKWIVFENLNNFTVEGGGTINGNGQRWWKKSCKVDKTQPCRTAPTALTFDNCKNFVVSNLKSKNAQQMHVRFQKCENVQAKNLRVIAPGNSPNTDGIHVTRTQHILISNSIIRTGDDCISIVNGSNHVEATNIVCGPGHGISIGSLGQNNAQSYVSNVFVHGAKLTGTTNGVRIKTWQGGSGYAKNIIFQDIAMKNVTNPIILDQNYCDKEGPCPEQKSAVQVSDVTYQNIKGTSASEVVVKFDCSKTYPCKGIVLQNIDLRSLSGGSAEASCDNVGFQNKGKVSPSCP